MSRKTLKNILDEQKKDWEKRKQFDPAIVAQGKPQNHLEEEFIGFVKGMKSIGYGRMMQMISALWYSKDACSAKRVGPCYGHYRSEEQTRTIMDGVIKNEIE